MDACMQAPCECSGMGCHMHALLHCASETDQGEWVQGN